MIPLGPLAGVIVGTITAISIGLPSNFAQAALAMGLIVLGGVLGASAETDIKEMRLPSSLTLLAAGLVLVVLLPSRVVDVGWGSLAGAALGAGGMFAIYYTLWYTTGGMGAGDVKLAPVLGAAAGLFGAEVAVVAFFAGFFVSLPQVAYLLIRSRARGQQVAFGPWMMLGAALAIALSGPIADLAQQILG